MFRSRLFMHKSIPEINFRNTLNLEKQYKHLNVVALLYLIIILQKTHDVISNTSRLYFGILFNND